MSKLFMKSTPPEEKTEEQPLWDSICSLNTARYDAAGQKLLAPNRKITTIGLVMSWVGSSPHPWWFEIRRASDDTLLYQSPNYQYNQLSRDGQLFEHTLTEPLNVDDEIRIMATPEVAYSANYIRVHYQNENVKANELFNHRLSGVWTDYPDRDAAYRYKYYEV